MANENVKYVTEPRFKQKEVVEFLTRESSGKVSATSIHRRLEPVYGDQTVDSGTVRKWVRLA